MFVQIRILSEQATKIYPFGYNIIEKAEHQEEREEKSLPFQNFRSHTQKSISKQYLHNGLVSEWIFTGINVCKQKIFEIICQLHQFL